MTPRFTPLKRRNPSGEIVWVARFRMPDGRRRVATPTWNGGKGTFTLKRLAQQAIDEAVELAYGLGVRQPETIRSYFKVWPERYPRAARTNATNVDRITRMLEIEIESRPLGDWRFDELRRRHALAIVDHLLRVDGRAVQGVRNMLGSLSVLTENAIDDEAAGANPFKGIRLRRNDPRAQKASKPIRVWSFAQMRDFAAGGRAEIRARTPRPSSKTGLCYSRHDYEALLLVPGLTGLRLGEFLALQREDFDGQTLTVRRTTHEGEITEGTKTDHGEPTAGRVVPCPPSLVAAIRAMPTRIDSPWLFPSPTGKLWRERNFYRDVWTPARIATGIEATPHHCRHSYVTHLHAAGIDPADLAKVAGHTVETMIGTYTHALERSHDRIREVIG
jgi:integrase